MASLNFYSSLARSYDSLYAEEQKRKIDLIKQSGIEIKGKLLDVGCGTGISTGIWKETKLKIGVDSCIELLRIAKKKYPGCMFICAKAEALPFKDNSFDAIICLTALHNFDSAERSLAEMKRVGKNDASCVISVLKKSKNFNKLVLLVEENFSSFDRLDDKHDLILLRKIKKN